MVETSLPLKILDLFLKSEGKEVGREIKNEKECRGGGGPGGGGGVTCKHIFGGLNIFRWVEKFSRGG